MLFRSFKLANGATGTLSASQVCVGRENGLAIRVFGTQGGLEWAQEHPNDLTVYWKDGRRELARAPKCDLAAALVEVIGERYAARGGKS